MIGREARAQLLEAEGALPEAVVACVGGGSNAIGMFAGFLGDADVRLVGVEAAGAASLGTGRTAVLHGARSSILADADGQIADAHSISAGLDYPGVGPEHAWLRDTGRAEYVPCTDDEALDAFVRLSRTEGIIPALESAHALAAVERLDAELPRGLPLRSRRQGPRRGARGAAEPRMSKALVIYLVCEPETPALAEAAVEGGRRPGRAGLPVLRPARRRPRHPARGRAGARARHAHRAVPRLPRRDARPRRRHAARPDDVRLAARGVRLGAFEADAAERGATGLIVADLPAGQRPELRRIQLVAPTSTDERIRLAAATRPTAGSTSSR